MRILVVDDETDLCEILRFNLESEGFEVDTANTAEEALTILTAQHSLILLDVMMDRMSGFEMAAHLRQSGNQMPIIFLTALGDEHQQLQGFEVGGDDYITKPFSFATVLARVNAVLKRANPVVQDSLTLDESHHLIFVDGIEHQLTNKEFAILKLMKEHEGEFFSREQILEYVWGNEVFVNDRSVDVHIARLRKKLGSMSDSVVNRSGLGYCYQSKK